MAQKQYTTYQADILSFELRDALLGIVNPGRYIGYNAMTENTPPAAGDIILDFDHTSYAAKYGKQSPPVLEANRGVAVSTQGTIIAEDSTVTLTLTFINHASGGYHILYMEHEYTEVQGANPATYGIKSGTGGGSAPALDSPTKQTMLGIIEEASNGAVFGDLTFFPAYPETGDLQLYDRLFLTSFNGTYDQGTVPLAGGIIGNRDFSTNNYVTDDVSLTAAIGALDAAIAARAAEITTLQGTKLDDWATPDDNTDLDVTITEHGLVPKAPNDVTQFLNGLGAWSIPEAGFQFVGSTALYHYNSTAQGGNITMGTTQQLSLASQVPVGYDQVILSVLLECFWGTGNSSGRHGNITFSKGGGLDDRQSVEGPHPLAAAALNGTPTYIYTTHQLLVPLDTSRQIQLSWGNRSGATTDWLRDIQIKVVGYR